MDSLAVMPTTPREAAAGGSSFALPPRMSVAPQSASSRELRASPCSSGSDGASTRCDGDSKLGSKRAPPRQWTEEEHALFLHGLELGLRGRWAKLAHTVLRDQRTPAQVASHAQKYFLKLEASRGKKSRPAPPEPATLLKAMQLLAAEEQEMQACSPADAAPACSSDSAGASCRPETPPRAVSSAAAVPTRSSPAPPPAAAAAPPPPCMPLARMVAMSFGEQLQRALLGGATMSSDECKAVSTLEALLRAPPAVHRRAVSA